MPDPIFRLDLEEKLSQGDIFENLEVAEAFATPPTMRMRVAVLTNSCDLDKQRPTALVVRMVPLADLPKGPAGDARQGRVARALFLPAEGAFPDSILDFEAIYRVPRASLIAAMEHGDRIASMTDRGRKALAGWLGYYIGREQAANAAGSGAPAL